MTSLKLISVLFGSLILLIACQGIPEKKVYEPGRTVSVAMSDPASWVNQGTPVVVALFEASSSSGPASTELLWSRSNDVGNSWKTFSSSNWPPPSASMSDGSVFAKYESDPDIIAINSPRPHHIEFKEFFIAAGIAGSVLHSATDVFVILGRGGNSWDPPLLLTLPPQQVPGTDPSVVRWRVEYVVADNLVDSGGFGFDDIWVLWRQSGINSQGDVVQTHWYLRKVALIESSPSHLELIYTSDPIQVPQGKIPAKSGPASISAAHVEIEIGRPSGNVYIAYPSYNNKNDQCPSADLVSVDYFIVNYNYTSDIFAGPVKIVLNRKWKKCVGESWGNSGSPYYKNKIRPELEIDPVSGSAYVAISQAVPFTPVPGTPITDYEQIITVHRTHLPIGGTWHVPVGFTLPGHGDSSIHDQWGHAFSFKREESGFGPYLGLTWYDTRLDAQGSSNDEVMLWGAVKEVGIFGWQNVTNISGASWFQGELWGRYNGLWPDTNTSLGNFIAVWGDNRTQQVSIWSAGVFIP